MSATVLKILAPKIDIGTVANTVNSGKTVHVFNNTNTVATLKINGTDSLMLGPYGEFVVEKLPTDLLLGTGLIATSVKYRG